MVVKWKFDDLTDSTTAQFEINPNEGGSFPYEKNITSQSTLAPGGKTLLFEGARAVPEVTFSGTILTQTQYNTMVTWFSKMHQIRITDDLGRAYMCYIKQFDAKRVRARQSPWKHSYVCTVILVDWP